MKNKLKKLVNKLQNKNPKLAVKLAQAVNQALVDGPSVQIDPSIQKDVQSAVDQIRKSDPNFFKGVSKIVGLTGGPFGKVESTDPTVIHVNLSRIKQQIQQQMGSNYKPSDPKHQEAFKEALERSIVETVSHERAHVLDFDPEQNKFPGGEGVAESGGKSMMQKMYQGKPIELQASLIQKRVAQVTGTESSSSGQGVDEYNKTGNDYMAGGTSVIPWETRLQALYKKFKSKKEKKAGLFYYKETGDIPHRSMEPDDTKTLHREDGPAGDNEKGIMKWYYDGVPHRLDGPARIWPGGEEYWVNGEQLSKKALNDIRSAKSDRDLISYILSDREVERWFAIKKKKELDLE